MWEDSLILGGTIPSAWDPRLCKWERGAEKPTSMHSSTSLSFFFFFKLQAQMCPAATVTSPVMKGCNLEL